jgi:hypothetical protein
MLSFLFFLEGRPLLPAVDDDGGGGGLVSLAEGEELYMRGQGETLYTYWRGVACLGVSLGRLADLVVAVEGTLAGDGGSLAGDGDVLAGG